MNKIKKRIVKIADSLSREATRRLKMIRGIVNFILISIFVMIFFLGFQGIINDEITGYFNILITFAILLLLTVLYTFLLRSDYRNGLLGVGNSLFFALGILAGVSGDIVYLTLADFILTTIWILTLFSLIYIWCKDNKKSMIKFAKKKKWIKEKK